MADPPVPKTPTHKRVREDREVLESPTKAQLQALEQVIVGDPAEDIVKQIQDTLVDHLDSVRHDPELQTAILASHHMALDDYAKYHSLNRGVLISPDVPLQGSLAAQDGVTAQNPQEQGEFEPLSHFIDDRPTGVTETRAYGPGIVTKTKGVSDPSAWDLVSGDGLTELTPKIVGADGESHYKASIMAAMPGWDLTRMAKIKLEFFEWACELVQPIDMGGSKRYARLHPETVNLWINLLYGSLDKPGWSNLRSIVKSVTDVGNDVLNKNSGLVALEQARSERNPLLKDFYHYLATSIIMDSKKDAHFYMLKGWCEYMLIESYDRLKLAMQDGNSEVFRRVVLYENTLPGGGGKGRKRTDQVKTYLAATLRMDITKLGAQINNGKPIQILISQLGPGFLLLMPYSDLRKLTKMCIGLAHHLVEHFVQTMTPEGYDRERDGLQGIHLVSENIRKHVMVPLINNNISELKLLTLTPAGKTDDILSLTNSQLVPRVVSIAPNGQDINQPAAQASGDAMDTGA